MKIIQAVFLLCWIKFYGNAALPNGTIAPTASPPTNITMGPKILYTSTPPGTMWIETTTRKIDPCSSETTESSTASECEDECRERTKNCQTKIETCVNFEGYYGCVCRKGLSQLVTNDEIFQGCYNVTSMTQKFDGIPYKEEFANTSSDEYIRAARDCEDIIRNSYRAKNPENPLVANLRKIVVTKITKGSVVVWFDAYSVGEPITPDMIRYYHNESLGTEYFSAYNFTVNFPRVALLICTKKQLLSTRNTTRNLFYTFDNAKPNTLVQSQESCQNSDIGYSATIECHVRKNADGTDTAYFESGTLREIPCGQSVFDLREQVKNMTLNSSNVDSLMSSISVISSEFASATAEEIKEVVAVLDEMKRQIKERGIEVTENSMNYLVWTTNNLNLAVSNRENNGTKLLLIQEKVQFIETLEVFASNLELKKETLYVKTDSSCFEAQRINQTKNAEVKFTAPARNIMQRKVTSYLPSTALTEVNDDSTNAVFFLHEDGVLFPSPTDKSVKINQVMSVQLSIKTLTNLVDPIIHTFPHQEHSVKTRKEGGRTITRERCGYFSIPDAEWKFDGCITDISNNFTVCRCNHTTNFAVLVQTQYLLSNLTLDALGTVGCICSIIGLVLLLIIYSFHRTLRTTLNIIHIQMSGCLLVAYITFVAGVERTRSYEACMAVGVILQFSFLCAWGWMLTEFITMYKKLVIVFTHVGTDYLVKASAIVYSTSLSITLLTLLISLTTGQPDGGPGWSTVSSNDTNSFTSNYVSDRLCWLHSYSLYFGFLTPVAIVLCINFVGFFLVVRTITRSSPDLGQSYKPTKTQLKDHATRVFMISFLLGITWIFAVPLTMTDDPIVNEVFSWLFSLSNAFQGLLLFLLYCVKRRDVRVLWIGSLKKLLPCCKLKRATKRDFSATNATSQSGNSATENRRIRHSENTDETVLSPAERSATIDMRVTSI